MSNVIDVEAAYKAAQPMMDAGDYKGLIPLLSPLADAVMDGATSVTDEVGASVLSNYGVCQRETGDLHDADYWFEMASLRYAHSPDMSARYVAAQSDFLRANLLREKGELTTARDLLSTMTMRIMMDDHAGLRHMFDMGMAEMKALEAMVGPARYGEADDAFTYSKRANAFEKTPRSWQFESERIICSRGGQSRDIPHDQIRQLHFGYAPTQFTGSRYVMTIQTRNGQREQIDNMDFAGVGNFVDKSAEYRAAVAALTGQLKARGANVDVISGRSWPYYVLMVVLAGFFVLMLPVLIALGGPIGIVMVLIGLITVGPRTWRWFKLNRPQTGTLDALPPGSMP